MIRLTVIKTNTFDTPFLLFLFLSICLDVQHLTNEHRTQDCITS